MRNTLALVLAAAFVATLPSLASAKSRHHRRYAPPVQVVDTNDSGPRLVGDALHQLIVPWQVTFAPTPVEVEPRVRHHRRLRRAARS